MPGRPPGGVQQASADAYPSGRRHFLVAGGVAMVAAGASGLVGRVLAERSNVSQARAAIRLPPPVQRAPALPAGADLHIRGLSPFVTPNNSFYRVDTALVLPQVPPSNWQLRIHGMVAHEMTLTFDDLLKLPLQEDWITLCCVSNPVGGPYIGNALWLGTSLSKLLRAAGIRAGAKQLLCTSADGFTFRPINLASTYGTTRWHLEGSSVGCLLYDAHDLGYDITTAFEQDAIIDLQTETLDLVFIVKRGIANRRSTKLHRLEHGYRSKGTRAAHLHTDI